jgi:iron complex outermembrane receptor protein
MRKSTFLLWMIVLFSIPAFSQTRTITGKVTNENGLPVPSATVEQKGTTNAVSATENGSFSIQV